MWHNAALSALLLAKSSALQTLNIRCCGLCDAGLGPVVEALRHNTHMTNLDCSDNNALDAHNERPRPSLLAPGANRVRKSVCAFGFRPAVCRIRRGAALSRALAQCAPTLAEALVVVTAHARRASSSHQCVVARAVACIVRGAVAHAPSRALRLFAAPF